MKRAATLVKFGGSCRGKSWQIPPLTHKKSFGSLFGILDDPRSSQGLDAQTLPMVFHPTFGHFLGISENIATRGLFQWVNHQRFTPQVVSFDQPPLQTFQLRDEAFVRHVLSHFLKKKGRCVGSVIILKCMVKHRSYIYIYEGFLKWGYPKIGGLYWNSY